MAAIALHIAGSLYRKLVSPNNASVSSDIAIAIAQNPFVSLCNPSVSAHIAVVTGHNAIAIPNHAVASPHNPFVSLNNAIASPAIASAASYCIDIATYILQRNAVLAIL